MRKSKLFIVLVLCLSLVNCKPSNKNEHQGHSMEEHSNHPSATPHPHANHNQNEKDVSNMSDDDMDMSDMDMNSTETKMEPPMNKVSPKKDPFANTKTLYRCPMHTHVISDKPGNCPICGMTLEKIENEDGDDNENQSNVNGRSTIKLSSRKQQLIGVKTGLIKKRPLKNIIRTVGKVEYNEQSVSHVHTKYTGWLEDVFVDYTGKFVQKGQALFSVYSPELVAAQKEYLIALKTQRQFLGSELESTAEMSQSLVQAAHQKLRLWDLIPTQINHLSATGQIKKQVTVYSPVSGYVTETKALKGMRITAGTPLYTIANLSTVWVNAQIYEYEIPQVKVGQYATITLPYLPGESFTGRISYIYPYLNPKSRTAKVRMVLNNAKGRLKPDMFTDVEIEVGSKKEQLTIPVSAVMDSGKRKIIYLAKEDGYFEPQEVTVGIRSGDFYQLITGPLENTKVVVEANFLIDSESQLKAAVSGMAGGHNH